jgi:hypothetical protein
MITRVDRGEAAMTWAEIGKALGYSDPVKARKSAYMIYKGAMAKIRKRPASIAKLRELVELRNRQAPSPTPFPEW